MGRASSREEELVVSLPASRNAGMKEETSDDQSEAEIVCGGVESSDSTNHNGNFAGTLSAEVVAKRKKSRLAYLNTYMTWASSQRESWSCFEFSGGRLTQSPEDWKKDSSQEEELGRVSTNCFSQCRHDEGGGDGPLHEKKSWSCLYRPVPETQA